MTQTCPYCNPTSCKGMCQLREEIEENLHKKIKKYSNSTVDDIIEKVVYNDIQNFISEMKEKFNFSKAEIITVHDEFIIHFCK